MSHEIVCGDVMEWAKSYAGPPFMALLCDPPYELGFMGKAFDKTGISFRPETWAALAEHLHPGAFGMAFASSRGFHRVMVAIEDAGLILHPSIFGWCYGSGFPKATRIDTQIDKVGGKSSLRFASILRDAVSSSSYSFADIDQMLGVKASSCYWVRTDHRGGIPPRVHWEKLREILGFGDEWDELYQEAEREVVGQRTTGIGTGNGSTPIIGDGNRDITIPATDLARTWAGHRYGLQALKPALEPIIVFQKPYKGKPVECITETGAGALNIDGARIGTGDNLNGGAYSGDLRQRDERTSTDSVKGAVPLSRLNRGAGDYAQPSGRWPANFVLIHSPLCVYKGTKRVKTDCGKQDTMRTADKFGRTHAGGKGWRGNPEEQRERTHADPDGKETVADWECVEECPVRRLGEQSGERPGMVGGGNRNAGFREKYVGGAKGAPQLDVQSFNDTGTAARFFLNVNWQLEQADPVRYCAKASRKERNAGLGFAVREIYPMNNSRERKDLNATATKRVRNPHPTVKPLALCK